MLQDEYSSQNDAYWRKSSSNSAVICSLTTVTTSLVNSDVSTTQKIFECDVCNNTFFTDLEKEWHVETEHVVHVDSNSSLSYSSNDIRPEKYNDIPCDQCETIFNTDLDLE